MSFVCAGLEVEHNYPSIAQAVGDVDLASRRVDAETCGPIQCGLAEAAFNFSGLTDLQEKLAVSAELEHVRVGWRRNASCDSSRFRGPRDPDISLRIHSDPCGRSRPVVSLTGTTPRVQ